MHDLGVFLLLVSQLFEAFLTRAAERLAPVPLALLAVADLVRHIGGAVVVVVERICFELQHVIQTIHAGTL